MASEAGKGSKPRPYSVTQEEYDTRWDAIFARDKDKDKAEVIDVYNDERLKTKHDK